MEPTEGQLRRKTLHPRHAEYLALRLYAALVLKYEEDVGEYLNLERQALELLLGREVDLLTPPPTPAGPRRAAA